MTDPSQEPGTQPTAGGFFVAPTPEALQEVLPGYEVVGFLGQGGMGAVYQAKQVALDRVVAIKVLPLDPENDTMNFAERFQREAQAMAKFLHSRIVAVFDFGKTKIEQNHPSGMTAKVDLLYIVIEFVEGTDLSKILAEDLLPHSQVINIFTQICDALSFAHSHGIVHRDIKPANIMLDIHGNVKVADFGLAKLTRESAAAQAQLTLSGTAMGTPDYVAPEVLEMDTEPDHRVDIYAMGVMLYQMLTGKIPRGLFRSPTELIPGLDPRLEEVIEKAMQADPDHRYQTVEEFWTDLDEIRNSLQPADPMMEEATIAMEKQPSSRVKIKPPEGSTQDVKIGAATHELEQKRSFPLKPVWIGVGTLAVIGVVSLFFIPSNDSTVSAGKDPASTEPKIQVPRESIDLLSAINLERDPPLIGSANNWKRENAGYQFVSPSSETTKSALVPEVSVSGDYNLEIEFHPHAEGMPNVVLPTGSSHIAFACGRSSPEGRMSAFDILNGIWSVDSRNSTRVPWTLTTLPSDVYLLHFRVRNLSAGIWRIECFLQGELHTSWEGSASDVQLPKEWSELSPGRVGLMLSKRSHGEGGVFCSVMLAPTHSDSGGQ